MEAKTHKTSRTPRTPRTSKLDTSHVDCDPNAHSHAHAHAHAHVDTDVDTLLDHDLAMAAEFDRRADELTLHGKAALGEAFLNKERLEAASAILRQEAAKLRKGEG